MTPMQAVNALWGGVVYRLRKGAYLPVSEVPPPLSWATGPVNGYHYDLDSSQRFVRPYLFSVGPYPHPSIGNTTTPFNNLLGTDQPIRIWEQVDTGITREPLGPYAGGQYGVVVQGGMTWGPALINGLVKQFGSG